MSEVMISRRGGGSGSGGSGESLHTEYIIFNQNWTVPSGVKNNSFDVRIFGAGGMYDGGSGWMNNGIFTNLTPGQLISISIGPEINTRSDSSVNTGGTTSFGTYLYASGGSGGTTGKGGSGGSGAGIGGTGYQFGGGSGGNGGDGGVWGGGGGGWSRGGNGGTYGGGGGGANMGWSRGGNGGTYGGGGGAGCWSSSSYDGTAGIGGTYGGRGGNHAVTAVNGTNTSTWTNVGKDDLTGEYFRGWGRAGSTVYSGGGGYGGNGGNGHEWKGNAWGGGGGGYGSNGGDAWSSKQFGGGGGGYGGDGVSGYYGAGGGGYGKVSVGRNGGGGYYCPGGGKNYSPTGGGGIGIWSTDGTLIASFGSGGWRSGNSWAFAESGICIIKYYT